MAEYFALIQKGQKPRQDSVLQSYATAYNLDGRNSRTTGVFSNDAYKSPEIGTAFSLTAEDNRHLRLEKGERSTASPHKFRAGLSELNNNFEEVSLRERHSYELAQSDSLYEQEGTVVQQEAANGFDVSMANQVVGSTTAAEKKAAQLTLRTPNVTTTFTSQQHQTNQKNGSAVLQSGEKGGAALDENLLGTAASMYNSDQRHTQNTS